MTERLNPVITKLSEVKVRYNVGALNQGAPEILEAVKFSLLMLPTIAPPVWFERT